MTIVFEMSTDPDIRGALLHADWPSPHARYDWEQVHPCRLGLANGIALVVIAHGNGAEIGNASPGAIDIDESAFLALVQGNMADDAVPAAIYISTCGPGIAEFTARVRLAAQRNMIWQDTRIFGHSDSVSGPVPPPGDLRWTRIFP